MHKETDNTFHQAFEQDDLEQEGMEVIYAGQPEGQPDSPQEEEEPVYAERPNKTALKREMVALQKLAGRLLEFSEQRLAPLGFSEKVRLAMAEGRRLKVPDARRRHQRFLAKLFLDEDTSAMEAFIDNIDGKHAAGSRQFHHLEQWRDRLIEEGDKAFEALLEEQPAADRQKLRQLIRTARKERDLGKPPAAARKLFKELRALFG
jgi:ribosome-associated protein